MDPCSRHPIVLQLGDVFPNFTAETTEGEISFHKWIGDSWAILFSHPADFTPVCTTELAEVARLSGEFKKRNVKPIALSCDDLASHREWIKDIKSYASIKEKEFPYPIIADNKRELADCLGMIDPEEKDAKGMPLTCRAVFIIGPDKRLKLSILYPATTGRNFDEILRVIDSLQLTYKKKVATPVNWKNGDKVMVLPNIPDIELPDLFPDGVTVTEVPSGRKYIRMTTQPQVDSDS